MEGFTRTICNGILYFAVFNALFFSTLRAADITEISVAHISEEIHVDGLLNEQAWQKKPGIGEFLQVEPQPGAASDTGTQVWLAYSRDSLYLAVRCEDSDPGRITATEMSRDADLDDNDNIKFVLDTYNDHRNAYYFSTNAVGALVDGRITENQRPALEWDGIWNVRTSIDDRGWTAEFEIPFKTIGFNPNIESWGFNISRHLARGRETSRWVAHSLDVDIHHIVRAGHITGLEGISQGVGLDIKPYGLVGFTRDINREDRVKGLGDGGVDIFYRITSNLVSSTTFNTDFAETEVDTRQVNLTRFPLFFPEKRSFFLEDAGIFEFARTQDNQPWMGGGGDLIPFFSRRIGLVGGDEIPIVVGQKLTGKIGRFDLGLLSVQTGRFDESAGENDLRVPSKNLSVGRIKANFLSQSYLGALFTNGDPAGEVSNQVGGVDLKLATSNFLARGKNLSLMLFGSKSNTTGVEKRDASYGGEISYPNDLLTLQYKWMKIEENYKPALGFAPRIGVRISSFSSEISPRPDIWNIRQMSFEFSYQDFYNLAEGSWETREMEIVPFQLRFNSGDFITYEFRRNDEQLFREWEINNGIFIPTGTYTNNTHSVYVMSSESRHFSIQANAETGSFYSGTRHQLMGELTWRKGRHLTSSFGIQQNWIQLPAGDFKTSLTTFRLDYSFTPFITLANFVQYDTQSQNIGLQSRLRWILTPGNEFFVVLNHDWQENQLNRFESARTRFRFKFNYVFRL